MIGKIVLILGILGILFGGAIVLVSCLLPVLNEGRTSWDEAMFGIIPGAVILFGAFIIFLVGLIIVLMKRKKKAVVT